MLIIFNSPPDGSLSKLDRNEIKDRAHRGSFLATLKGGVPCEELDIKLHPLRRVLDEIPGLIAHAHKGPVTRHSPGEAGKAWSEFSESVSLMEGMLARSDIPAELVIILKPFARGMHNALAAAGDGIQHVYTVQLIDLALNDMHRPFKDFMQALRLRAAG